MNKLSTAEVHESKLLETLCLLSAVCRLTVTGTWEIQVKNNTGNSLAALNMSQEARFITGYLNPGQTSKEFLEKVIPFEDQIKIQEAFNLALERKSVFSIRHRILQGQAVRIIYQRGEFLHDKDNKEILKMLCICSDITDYQSAFRISEGNEEDFAFITSHKLRAPLSNILALSDLLKNTSVSLVDYDQIKELLLIIGEQAEHLDDAVRKLNKLVFNTNKSTFKTKVPEKVKELILIDDEPLANKIHTRLISSMNPQLKVTAFTDPCEGMGFLKDKGKDALLLLDINMPVMDAWTCLDYMREHKLANEVIILSSSINPIDKQKASGYTNVVGFLNKPLTKENIRWIVGLHDS